MGPFPRRTSSWAARGLSGGRGRGASRGLGNRLRLVLDGLPLSGEKAHPPRSRQAASPGPLPLPACLQAEPREALGGRAASARNRPARGGRPALRPAPRSTAQAAGGAAHPPRLPCPAAACARPAPPEECARPRPGPQSAGRRGMERAEPGRPDRPDPAGPGQPQLQPRERARPGPRRPMRADMRLRDLSLRQDPDLRQELASLARGCDFVLPSRFKKRLKAFQQVRRGGGRAGPLRPRAPRRSGEVGVGGCLGSGGSTCARARLPWNSARARRGQVCPCSLSGKAL